MTELLELTDRLRSEGVNIRLKENLNLFYGAYPHVVRITYHGRDVTVLRAKLAGIRTRLTNKLVPWAFKIRQEWTSMSIFCQDPKLILENLGVLKNIDSIVVESMKEDILEATNKLPEGLPRAVTKVSKSLPWKKYRYKIYWPSTSRTLQKIGKESIEAIVGQINNSPKCKRIERDVEAWLLRMHSAWGTRYFYTEDEEILYMVSLIDARFIAKIERIVTLEEVNAEKSSGSITE